MRDLIGIYARKVKEKLKEQGIESLVKYGSAPVGEIKKDQVWLNIRINSFGASEPPIEYTDKWICPNRGSFTLTVYYIRGIYEIERKIKQAVIDELGRCERKVLFYAKNGTFQTKTGLIGETIWVMEKTMFLEWSETTPKEPIPNATGVDISDLTVKI